MKKIDQFKALFPLEGEITEEILREGSKDVSSTTKCIGALTFTAALGENAKLLDKAPKWLVRESAWSNEIEGDQAPIITTPDAMNFMKAKEPQKVTFILKQ